MKKLKICISCFICLLIGGCGNKKSSTSLKVKQTVFIVEFGNEVSLDAETYLDTSKLKDTDKKSVLADSTLTIELSQNDLVHKDSKNYPKVGTYKALITYNDETLYFTIEVKDTKAPELNGPEALTVPVGGNLDILGHFTATDLSEMKPMELKNGEVDIHTVGDYSVEVVASDIYGNTQSKKLAVNVFELENSAVDEQSNTEHAPSTPPTNPSVPDSQPPAPLSSIKLDVPYYNQMDVNAPMGCEATSLYMGLQYKGYIQQDLYTFINNLPRSDNPHSGFSGDPFVLDPNVEAYQGVFAGPLASYGNQFGPCVNISGASIDTIIEELRNDHPVVAYVTLDFAKPIVKEYTFGSAVENGHVVLISGFDLSRQVLYIQDPYRSDLKEVSMENFKNVYSSLKYAVAIY